MTFPDDTFEALYDLDPLNRIIRYLDAREGIVHRNVDTVWMEGGERVYLTTLDLRRVVSEVIMLREEIELMEGAGESD